MQKTSKKTTHNRFHKILGLSGTWANEHIKRLDQVACRIIYSFHEPFSPFGAAVMGDANVAEGAALRPNDDSEDPDLQRATSMSTNTSIPEVDARRASPPARSDDCGVCDEDGAARRAIRRAGARASVGDVF